MDARFSDPASSRRVVPDLRARDRWIAVAVGLAVFGFICWAILTLNRTANSSGGVEGIIVRKEFVPAPETQITVGRGGVTSREIAGRYILHVQVARERGRIYDVYVSSSDYQTHQVGERYYFIRARSGG